MDVNIQKYQAFLKAVEYGSFTKAAEALSYSQSGISRMIGDLEQEWNIILLERGRGGVRLTSDAYGGLDLRTYNCAAIWSVSEMYPLDRINTIALYWWKHDMGISKRRRRN